jgi:hypothetical protein
VCEHWELIQYLENKITVQTRLIDCWIESGIITKRFPDFVNQNTDFKQTVIDVCASFLLGMEGVDCM